MITYRSTPENVDWAAMRQILQADQFHNGRTPEQYRISFENSFAFVLAYADDALIGTARLLSDGVCNAYIVDVWTLSTYRNQGIARTMMAMLEARVPGQHVCLWTDSATGFYEKIGYTRPADTLYEKVVGEWLQNETRDA